MMYKNNKGFTLIELIIVISLMTIAIGVTSDVLINLIRTYSKSSVTNEIEQNANFVSQKLVKELRNATKIETLDPEASGPLAQNDAFNEITFLDQNGDPVTYSVTGGVVYRDAGSGLEALTSNVAPQGVNVTCVSGTSCFRMVEIAPQVVQLYIRMTQSGTPGNLIFEGEITIEDVIVIRDTY